MERPNTPVKTEKTDIVIKICISACLLLTLVLYIYGQFFVHNPSLYANKCELYDAVWSYTDPSGATKQYRVNERFDKKGVTDVVLKTQLPDSIDDGSCLFILTGKDLDAYVDGELRNSYRLSYSPFGRNVKGQWISITLRKSDEGKTLTVVRPNYWLDDFYITETYIGNRLGFAVHLMGDNLFILFLGFSLIIFGMVTTVICLAYRIKRRRDFPLWYLSLGVFAGAIWLLLDSYTYPLFFRNYFIDGITAFLVIMLLPFPFAAYINSLLDKRYRKIYYTLSFLIIANFTIQSILNFTDIADFNTTMPISNTIMGIVAVYCFSVLIYDRFKMGHRENTLVTIGFTLFALLAIIEIIHLNLPVHTNDGAFIAAGLLLLLIFAISHEIVRISELRAETLEAQKANQAKTTFLANMSHEIRTPINAILGMDELILREDTDPKVREYASNIKSAGTALLEIISDVLDFSKIEQGKMEIVESEYDIKTLINSIITMIEVRADEKGLSFIKDISSELPSKLVGDEKRLREVMINLLGNAVKYTPKGSVTFSVSRESTDEQHIILIISVKDTGIGIKESDRSKLFMQFERLDHARTQSIEGTGLGLAISANLIRLMGGTIDCSSTYGEGTEFIVRIPQTVTDSAPIGNINSQKISDQSGSSDEALSDLSGVSVLVVDDSTMNIKVASGLLGILKADVTACKSGAEMLDIIRQKKFDIILLDHMMPVMDGIETLERSRFVENNLNTDTPYIALTANAIAGAREMYLEKGFTDYLSKPMKIEELSAVISSHLGACLSSTRE